MPTGKLKKYSIEIKAAVSIFNETIQDAILKAIDEKVKGSGGDNVGILDAWIRELERTLLACLD